MMAMPRRRIHAEYAVIAALISTASSVVGAAQLPVTTWLRSEWAHPAANVPMHQVTASMQNAAEPYGQGRSVSSEYRTVFTALIRPAPLGEITPDPPPEVPPPTVKPLVPSVAAPPPRAEQPLSPPRQEERPPPEPQAPAPEPQAPAPQPQGPPSGQEAPPAQPPPRGHVQLAP
jgi:Flp pilus assembly pilin Flp